LHFLSTSKYFILTIRSPRHRDRPYWTLLPPFSQSVTGEGISQLLLFSFPYISKKTVRLYTRNIFRVPWYIVSYFWCSVWVLLCLPVGLQLASGEDVGLGRLDTGIVTSNPAQSTCAFTSLSVLCCPVVVEALRLADPHPVSPTTFKLINNFRNNSELQ
jgi:hypothetical protein